jgi:hypothetical protein
MIQTKSANAKDDQISHLQRQQSYSTLRLRDMELANKRKRNELGNFGYLRGEMHYRVPSTSVVRAMSLEGRLEVARAVHEAVTGATKRVCNITDEQLGRILKEWGGVSRESNVRGGPWREGAKPCTDEEWDEVLAVLHTVDVKSMPDTDVSALLLALGISGMSHDVKKVRMALNAVIEARINITEDEYGTHCNVEDVVKMMIKVHGGTADDYDVNFNGDGRDYSGKTTTLCALRLVLRGDDHKATAVTSLWPIAILNGKEEYPFLEKAMANMLEDLKRIQDEGVFVDFPGEAMSTESNCTITLWLSADMKFLNLTTGMTDAKSPCACIYCHASTKHPPKKDAGDTTPSLCCSRATRHNPTTTWKVCRDANEPIGRGRIRKNLFGFIPTERIVVDLLHMFLRISDRLIMVACDAALLSERDNSNPGLEEDKAEDEWLTDTFGKEFGRIAGCTVKIKADDAQKVWSTTRLNGNKKKLIVRDFKFDTVFKKNKVVGAQLQKTWDDFWTLYSLLNQHDPLLSIVNAFNAGHDDTIYEEGELKEDELRKQASDAWQVMTLAWLYHTLLRSDHPTAKGEKVEPATPLSFLTPYVHVFAFHVGYLLLHVGSLHDFTCQNLELANNLQGKQVHRQNCRRADLENMQVIMASLRNLLNIPAAVKDKSYRRKLFCPFCPGHAGCKSMGYLRRHLRGKACPGKEEALTAKLKNDILKDSWARHYATLEESSCHEIVMVKSDAKEHYDWKQPETRKVTRRSRADAGLDTKTKKAYLRDKELEAEVAASLGAVEHERKSRQIGEAKLIPDLASRDAVMSAVSKYADLGYGTTTAPPPH